MLIALKSATGRVIALLTIEEYLAMEEQVQAALIARAATDPVK